MLKKRIKLLCALLAAAGILTSAGTPAAANGGEPSVSAKAAVLMTADNSTVLYEKAAEEKLPMASTTKIMTALLTLEAAQAEDRQVKITDEMVRVEGSSMGLKPGNVVTLTALAQGMLLCSGNDAANAAAIAIAGSTEEFAKLMNQRAKQIGMKNTNFVTPSGLDDENHYTTAYDMALLGACAMENQRFREIASQKSMQVQFVEPDMKYTFGNHNRLLTAYEGCIGVKTGFTKKSGRCLVSCAERDGVRLVAVTLNAPDDWNDHKALLDYGFSTFPRQVLAEEGEELGRVPLQGSLLHMASVEARETVAYPLKQGEEVTMEVDLPDQAEAPVVQGEIAGSVRFLVGSRQVGQTYLVWSGSARRDVVKERPVDSPLDFLPQSTPPTYEEMLSLFSKAGTVSE